LSGQPSQVVVGKRHGIGKSLTNPTLPSIRNDVALGVIRRYESNQPDPAINPQPTEFRG
jgi:hypothetical protein